MGEGRERGVKVKEGKGFLRLLQVKLFWSLSRPKYRVFIAKNIRSFILWLCNHVRLLFLYFMLFIWCENVVGKIVQSVSIAQNV